MIHKRDFPLFPELVINHMSDYHFLGVLLENLKTGNTKEIYLILIKMVMVQRFILLKKKEEITR